MLSLNSRIISIKKLKQKWQWTPGSFSYFADFHTVQHKSLWGVENEGKQPCACSSQMSLASASCLCFPCFPQLFLLSLTTSPFLFSSSLHFPLGIFYRATWQCVWGLMQIVTHVLDSFVEAASSWITGSRQKILPGCPNANFLFSVLSHNWNGNILQGAQ